MFCFVFHIENNREWRVLALRGILRKWREEFSVGETSHEPN